MATLSSILAWRIPWQRSLECYGPWGHNESDTTEWLTLTYMRTVPWMTLFLVTQSSYNQPGLFPGIALCVDPCTPLLSALCPPVLHCSAPHFFSFSGTRQSEFQISACQSLTKGSLGGTGGAERRRIDSQTFLASLLWGMVLWKRAAVTGSWKQRACQNWGCREQLGPVPYTCGPVHNPTEATKAELKLGLNLSLVRILRDLSQNMRGSGASEERV